MGLFMKLDLINEKVYNEKNIRLVTKIIIDSFVAKDKWYRKPLINNCLEQLNLSDQIKSDKSYNSLFTKCKNCLCLFHSEFPIFNTYPRSVF